jgi:phosphoglycerol transferase MdoB-like AlkP superfamily enzyme
MAKKRTGKKTKKSRLKLGGIYRGNIHLILLLRLATVTAFLFLSRAVFLLFNLSYFTSVPPSELLMIFLHGLRFDISAVCLVNLPFIAMYLLPFRFRENRWYLIAADIVFYVSNILAMLVNFVDMIYFRFTLKRLTADIFMYLGVGGDFDKLIPQFLKDFWYILISFLFFIALLVLLASRFRVAGSGPKGKPLAYYLLNLFLMAVFGAAVVLGIRGGLQLRPINVVTAANYTSARNMVLVLNTPFTILRTWNDRALKPLRWFKSEKELAGIYTPVHPASGGSFRKMNVMIIILESFSREHIGLLNRDLEEGRYQGFTPFMDSLIQQGLYFDAYANGKTSIQGIPAILSSIPSLMDESFIQSPYAAGKYTGIAGLLKPRGYTTAFFHGGTNGTMGFDSYTHLIGFEKYFGRKEYHNEADYDGKWGIRDEEFLQYTAGKLDGLPQPFCAALFTLSSHHPYYVPPKYSNVLRTGKLPIQQSIMYADQSLAKFFHTAKHMSWYKNTLFVITADHTSEGYYPWYATGAGQYAVPLLFYSPGGELRGMPRTIAQQTDVLPTVMTWLGYPGPYVSFGTNLLDTNALHFSIHYNSGVYGMMKDGYLIEFNGTHTTRLFDLKNDRMQKNDLKSADGSKKQELELFMKAFIQQYNNRLIENRLSAE